MKLLLDTQILLWASAQPGRLKPGTRRMLGDTEHTLLFSAASLWEIAIKASLGREDFNADPRVLRRALLDNGYVELAISGAHAAAVLDLPPIHRDPFDRLLVAQAQVEGITLITADAIVARYPGPIRRG
ncbi:MAG: type II toxin-antitoxin system VapC family toxin [Gemmatimonadaceae bacterium]|jgi:PIN domain nuclease of toxin-antitoxin system|nr:type II toxin-antitoxin system VapC family toxin [Gemmatimonadaceae bacterium]